jgi:hypothetical protein
MSTWPPYWSAKICEFVDEDGYVDLPRWTGRPLSHIPLDFRLPGEWRIHCDSFTSFLSDAACDPRSGGIADTGYMARVVGIKTQQFTKHVLSQMEFVHQIGNLAVSNVTSIYAFAGSHMNEVYAQWCENLGIRPVDCP